MRLAPALVALLLAATAGAAPLDDWLAATADAPRVVVVPRLAAVTGTVGRLATRARQDPALAAQLETLTTDLIGGLDLDVLDPAALDAAGVDLGGPLLAVDGPTGGLVIAMKGAAFADTLLGKAVGARAVERDGHRAWTWADGVAVFADGALFVAGTDAALAKLRAKRAGGPDPIAGCARQRGEADVFVFTRGGEAPSCTTVRLDPDRVRVDAVLQMPKMKPPEWLARGDGLPRHAADPSLVIAVWPAPTTSALIMAALAPDRQADVGPVSLTLGAKLTDVVLSLTTADPVLLERFAARVAERPEVKVTDDGDGLRRITPLPEAGPSPVDAVWFGQRKGRMWVSTRRAAIGAPPAPAASTALSGDLFDGAGLAVLLRPAGLPHDGSRWIDAIAPRLRALDLDPAGLRDVAKALAFGWAHLGDVGVAVRADGDAWRIAVEVMIL